MRRLPFGRAPRVRGAHGELKRRELVWR